MRGRDKELEERIIRKRIREGTEEKGDCNETTK